MKIDPKTSLKNQNFNCQKLLLEKKLKKKKKKKIDPKLWLCIVERQQRTESTTSPSGSMQSYETRSTRAVISSF